MKSVLISIKPKGCELIVNGKKTIEVRKTKPKLETPFKCYIYCTIGNGIKGDYIIPSNLQCGKVIGDFICNMIDELPCGVNQPFWLKEKTCIEDEHYKTYLGNKNGYGWHISELKIYDKPKELSEFKTPEWYRDCEKGCPYSERMRCPTKDSHKVDKMCGWCRGGNEPITRLSSWCYVEK